MNIEKHIKFNIKKAIANPSRIRQVNLWDKRFVEVICTKYGKGVCKNLIVGANGFSSPCSDQGQSICKTFVLVKANRKDSFKPKTFYVRIPRSCSQY